MSKVDDVALAMVNACRAKRGEAPVEHIEKIAKEAVPYLRIKATAAIEYLATLGAALQTGGGA